MDQPDGETTKQLHKDKEYLYTYTYIVYSSSVQKHSDIRVRSRLYSQTNGVPRVGLMLIRNIIQKYAMATATAQNIVSIKAILSLPFE